MEPTNLLFLFSDQHRADFLGCAGHPTVRTPHLDRLAARGTRFANAYTNCPICVPARASLATGRYVHDIGYWDNAFPYDGRIPSWHHRLRAQGIRVDSIGKLHFQGQGTDHGFTEEVEPLHVVEGVGDVLSCIRADPPRRYGQRRNIEVAGSGDSTYLQYDRRNAANACRWLQDHAADEQPWMLFVSLVCPHPPFIAPPALYEEYRAKKLAMPRQWQPAAWPDHPALARMRHFFHLDEPFTEEELQRLHAAYHGTTTFLDQQIGQVLTTLEEVGLTDRTRVIYSSDHGESLGERGHVGKFLMYEETAGIPFLMAGPDVPAGRVVETPISLVDLFPTIVEAVGADHAGEQQETAAPALPGASLWALANQADQERTIFSEYHAVGSANGFYMVRDQRYKYVHYTHEPAQLFDLATDPNETTDLAAVAEHQALRAQMEEKLRTILDPEATDARAKADQRARVETLGGEAAVRAKGAFDNSPTPGETPRFQPGDH
ncbi:MAG TPA: sulfatase-like hydrolase/transferase [Caldilineaceae bacterium]|nr:sulfatase-like hydrolase/transferase [Caldilineaceae bacterium]